MLFTFLKYLHITGAILLVGSVFTLDTMMLRLILSHRKQGLKVFYQESKFIERAIIGPSAVLMTLSGIVMAQVWFGWPFWLIWGMFVVLFTGWTGSITIPRLKKQIIRLTDTDSPDDHLLHKYTLRFILLISADLLLLLSAVGTMVYKPML